MNYTQLPNFAEIAGKHQIDKTQLPGLIEGCTEYVENQCVGYICTSIGDLPIGDTNMEGVMFDYMTAMIGPIGDNLIEIRNDLIIDYGIPGAILFCSMLKNELSSSVDDLQKAFNAVSIEGDTTLAVTDFKICFDANFEAVLKFIHKQPQPIYGLPNIGRMRQLILLNAIAYFKGFL